MGPPSGETCVPGLVLRGMRALFPGVPMQAGLLRGLFVATIFDVVVGVAIYAFAAHFGVF
jgi:hypothetical protein